jgi:hypothetical protein
MVFVLKESIFQLEWDTPHVSGNSNSSPHHYVVAMRKSPWPQGGVHFQDGVLSNINGCLQCPGTQPTHTYFPLFSCPLFCRSSRRQFEPFPTTNPIVLKSIHARHGARVSQIQCHPYLCFNSRFCASCGNIWCYDTHTASCWTDNLASHLDGEGTRRTCNRILWGA